MLADCYVETIAAAGFDTVRLPIRWPAWAAEDAPYLIDRSFFAHVDAAVEQVLVRGLNVILTMHFYDSLMSDPARHEPRFLALWQQITEHFGPVPAARMAFELLNEPTMSAQVWNELLVRGLAQVRSRSSDRDVLIGPVNQNAVDALGELTLPADEHLIAVVHYYEPLTFTHQSAPWLAASAGWAGTAWGAAEDLEAVRRDLQYAAAWAASRGLPLLVSEFGTYEAADLTSRGRWTTAVRTELERLGVPWCYWDFGGDFGAFDPSHGWREPLRTALLRPPEPRA